MAIEELSEPPSMRPLYAKAALGALPGGGGGGGDELPDLELVLPEVNVDPHHLTAYDRVCGFRLSDELPPTYLHVYGFPMAMRIMTDRAFPFAVLGLVHIGNRITQRRAVLSSEVLSLRVRAENLRDHPKGRQVDLVAEARAGEDLVWSSVSTYLKIGAGAGGGDAGSGDESSPEERAEPGRNGHGPSGPTAALWSIPDDMGRRYAAVSGDVNPIHLSSLSARVFGFKKAIAHGMWSKARCLAAFEGRLGGPFTVDVAFQKPVLLPSKVAFRSARMGEGAWAFDLRDPKRGTPHLTGEIAPA